MSQKETKKENFENPVIQISDSVIENQTIIVTSQGEVKSQLQAQSQDPVPSQVQDSQAVLQLCRSCVASQDQVLTQAQLASQNNVSSQGTVASQGRSQTGTQTEAQLASQNSVGTQARSVSSQPIVPTLSQKANLPSQRSVSSSQDAVSSQKRKPRDIIADMTAIIEAGQQATSSEDSQTDARQKTNE